MNANTLIVALAFVVGGIPWGAEAAPCVQKPIDTTKAFTNGGFRYVMDVKFGVLPDWGASPATATTASLTRSPARLFENGTELGPSHSVHTDIGNVGKGRFSHWGNENGSIEALFFSASDNSDPRSNGKAYTYCVGLDAPVTTTTMPPPPTTTTTTTLPLCSAICRQD